MRLWLFRCQMLQGKEHFTTLLLRYFVTSLIKQEERKGRSLQTCPVSDRLGSDELNYACFLLVVVYLRFFKHLFIYLLLWFFNLLLFVFYRARKRSKRYITYINRRDRSSPDSMSTYVWWVRMFVSDKAPELQNVWNTGLAWGFCSSLLPCCVWRRACGNVVGYVRGSSNVVVANAHWVGSKWNKAAE